LFSLFLSVSPTKPVQNRWELSYQAEVERKIEQIKNQVKGTYPKEADHLGEYGRDNWYQKGWKTMSETENKFQLIITL
jgi:hypothetical protein